MKRTSFPPGPKNWYPMRIALAMRRDPISFLSFVAHGYGDFTHFRAGKQHVYLLNHPDYLRRIWATDADKFVKTGGTLRARSLIGEGLLTSEGEKHHRQRRLIQPVFHHRKIIGLASTMVDCGLAHQRLWRDGLQVDMVEEMRRLTLRIISKTMFGVDIEAAAGKELQDFAGAVRLFDSMTPLLLWIRRISHRGKGASQARARHEAIRRIIEGRRKNPDEADDLLSLLIEAVDHRASETGMTEKQLRDEMMTILEAGHESTATALSWTWYLLSQNPDAEQKMHWELDEVLGGRPPAADDLAQLPYTVNVFNEAMRLFPPSWVLARAPINDYELDGHVIPAGSSILLSQYVMQRDKRFFEDPDRFMPERWLAQKGKPHSSYIPFGYGPRRCIGEGFTMMEGPLLLAVLGSTWQGRLVSNHTVKKLPLIILRPNGVPMILKKRSR